MDLHDNDIENLYEKSFRHVEEGSIIKGRIIAKMPDSVVVDIGYKSEGFIPIDEFEKAEEEKLQLGDELEVYVTRLSNSDGFVHLSRDKASKIRIFEKIQEAHRTGTAVTGKILERIKGGFYVDIGGFKAFMPGSQADITPTNSLNELINSESLFKILKLNTKLTNVIVSRRAVLEEERAKLREKTLKKIEEGTVIKGVVKNITDYGVFIDLGGIDGLLHISDISWGRISHPSEYFNIGDTADVIVLQYSPEKEKVTLGYKQHKPNPWLNIEGKYPVGKKVQGKVVTITDYGVFLEVEEGVEGLVHISELVWDSRPKHPSQYLNIGDVKEAVVLKVDGAEKRLSLSVKQLKPKPWELVAQRYSAGQKIAGRIKTITKFGAFVGLSEGVDGLIHISDISWTRHIKHPSEVLRKGQKVETLILALEPEKEKMALGIKQLTEDPWIEEIPNKYHLGDEVTCKVLRITDFGIFAEINSDIEGLIYSSEIEGTAVKPIEDSYKEGDTITARIIRIEQAERKIGLSMKNLSPKAAGPLEGEETAE